MRSSPTAANASSAAAPLLTTLLLLENTGGGAHDEGDDTESGDGAVPAPPPPLRPEFWRERRNGECAAELTRAVNLFNPQMVDMVRGLNRAIGADVFVTANTYRMNFDYLANPQDFGELDQTRWRRCFHGKLNQPSGSIGDN